MKLRDRIDALELSLDEATESLTSSMVSGDEVKQHIASLEEEKARLAAELQNQHKLLADAEALIKILRGGGQGVDVTLAADKELLSARLERDALSKQVAEVTRQLREAEQREKEAIDERASIQQHNEQLQQYCSRLRLQLEEATRRLKLVRPMLCSVACLPAASVIPIE